jgi:simple sugar transport system permease protein
VAVVTKRSLQTATVRLSMRNLANVARARSEHLGLTLALLALIAFYALTAPNFFTLSNFTNVLQNISYLGIIAWGMTLVIIAGDIDVSVGSAAAFYGVLLAIFLGAGLHPAIAIMATLLAGATVGVGAGFLRAAFLIPSFIVTLGLFGVLRGLALLITNAIPLVPPAIRESPFTFIGRGAIAGVPFSAFALILLFIVFWFVSTKTTLGKEVFAIGGNAAAAHLAGIRVGRTRAVIFGITGLLAATAGVLLASALGAGDPVTSQGLEFDVIAAVILGGTSLSGGRGSMAGTALGVLFIGLLGNGLVLLGVNPYANLVVRGAVILIAVLVTSAGLREQIRTVTRQMRGG